MVTKSLKSVIWYLHSIAYYKTSLPKSLKILDIYSVVKL